MISLIINCRKRLDHESMIHEFEKDGKHQNATKLRINNKLHQTFISRMLSNNTIQDIFDITVVINCYAMNRFVMNARNQSD